jgi:hypothetical protein
VNRGRNVYAINAEGIEKWIKSLEEYVGVPDVDPDESQIFVPAGGTSASPAALQSLSTANGGALWRMEFPSDGSGLEQFVDTGLAFSADGGSAYVVTAVAGGNASYLNAIDTDPSIPSASTQLRSADIAMTAKSKRRSVDFSGTVTVLDENRQAVSGAVVYANWILPDGSIVDAVSTTGGAGEAGFTLSADGGLYWLEVTGITREGYVFDPAHSILGAGIAWF